MEMTYNACLQMQSVLRTFPAELIQGGSRDNSTLLSESSRVTGDVIRIASERGAVAQAQLVTLLKPAQDQGTLGFVFRYNDDLPHAVRLISASSEIPDSLTVFGLEGSPLVVLFQVAEGEEVEAHPYIPAEAILAGAGLPSRLPFLSRAHAGLDLNVLAGLVHTSNSQRIIRPQCLIDPNVKRQLDTSLDDCQFSVRVRKVFDRIGCRFVGEVAALSEDELYKVRNCGRGSLKDIEKFLGRLGLALGMKDQIRQWGWQAPPKEPRGHQAGRAAHGRRGSPR